MINHYFPTAVFSEMNIPLAEAMLPVARKYLDDKEYIGNRWDYKNTFDKSWKLVEQPDIKPYTDYVTEKSKQFLDEIGYNPNVYEWHKTVFVSEIFKNDNHEKHSHPDSTISGLLYLQVPENSAPLIFMDPRPHRNFISMPKTPRNTVTNREKIVIIPRKGLFLAWESWLPHAIPKSNNEGEGRITMVFNLKGIQK
jgi:uncharacterized protein (TIGR02466 family)